LAAEEGYLGDIDAEIKRLKAIALETRKWIVKMTYEAGSGHPGGSLSATDILTALYFHVMRHNPKNPTWKDRDRFILSKGHAAPALYATLAQAGYFPVEELLTLRKLGSRLQGHPCMLKCPGVDMSTGSLGQGLSVANGIALAAKLDRRMYRVFVLLGDGECDSGQVWEAGMATAHYKLDNVTAFIDRNTLQIDGSTEQVMSLEPLAFKWKSFGWHILEIDGHNMKEIIDATEKAKEIKGKPTMIIAHTIKGKGVSFMEGTLYFHGKAPTKEQMEEALRELESVEI
jgi:transketolase